MMKIVPKDHMAHNSLRQHDKKIHKKKVGNLIQFGIKICLNVCRPGNKGYKENKSKSQMENCRLLYIPASSQFDTYEFHPVRFNALISGRHADWQSVTSHHMWVCVDGSMWNGWMQCGFFSSLFLYSSKH